MKLIHNRMACAAKRQTVVQNGPLPHRSSQKQTTKQMDFRDPCASPSRLEVLADLLMQT